MLGILISERSFEKFKPQISTDPGQQRPKTAPLRRPTNRGPRSMQKKLLTGLAIAAGVVVLGVVCSMLLLGVVDGVAAAVGSLESLLPWGAWAGGAGAIYVVLALYAVSQKNCG